jgi:hypothetical protein
LKPDWTGYGELGELAETVYSALQVRDTKHPVFHGSWDWHSAVHGHWALLRLAEHVGDTQVVDALLGRLCPADLERELAYLIDNPNFELPYGRAWLLLLLRDLEACFGLTQHRGGGEQIAAGLLEWLNTCALSPDVGEYMNPCWVLLRLYDWSEHVGDKETCRLLSRMVHRHFRVQGMRPEQDFTRPEFFTRWGLQVLLLSRVLGAGPAVSWVEEQGLDEAALRPLSQFDSVHHLGMNASRSWAFAELFALSGEPKWQRADAAHFEASMVLYDVHRNEHAEFGHWVPQFIVFGWLKSRLPGA